MRVLIRKFGMVSVAALMLALMTAMTPRTFNSTAVTQIVTGLSNGTTYTFRVKAHNSVGTGPNSVACAAVKIGSAPATPAAPRLAPGNVSARVNWVAPAPHGLVITGYVVTPFVGAVAKPAHTFDSTANAQSITGLVNGTTYKFKVAAKNARGTSSASPMSGAVVPTAQPTIKLMMNATIGQPILVNSYGMTLYRYVPDGTGTMSHVTAGLRTVWPYVTWSGALTIGAGLTLGSATANIQVDNTRLIAYNGHPLYTFVSDHAPGDATGQGLNQFFVLDASGNPIP